MDMSIRKFNTSLFEYLTEEQMKEIHSASLNLLEDMGTVIHHGGALELLKKAGAYVAEGNRVYIPGGLVEWAIKSAPSRITVYDRNGNPAMLLEGRNSYYGTGSDCPNIVDTFSGERRKFTYKDVENAVKIVDYLPNIDFTMSMGLISDCRKELSYHHEYALMLRNTVKPQVITASDRDCLNDIADIAAAAVGGRETLSRKPIFVLYDEPTSPMVHSEEAIDKLLFMAENSLPTNYAPGMMAGATGPITVAGAITQATAETLAGLVIHQLKKPGAPFVFGAGVSPIDMSSMQPTYSAPEAMLGQSGLCEIGRRLYDLPTWGFGGCSASKLADEQAVNEAGSYILMAGLSGTNIIHDVGYLEFGLTYSFDLLVMCDEIIGQVRRLMEGIKVDREHIALDAIKRVGAGGHYLGDEHTFNHFRENWRPDITDRRTYEAWVENGAATMGQRAKAKVRHVLENHIPEALPDAVNQEIDRIIKSAEERLCK